jgi:hypothetical protein
LKYLLAPNAVHKTFVNELTFYLIIFDMNKLDSSDMECVAEMERNIEMQNLRKEKEEADLKLVEEEEKKKREVLEKADYERRVKEAKEKALEKKDREEKRRLERRLESERREREEKERIEKETRDREDEVNIERLRLERESIEKRERKGRLERRQSKDEETKNERDEHEISHKEEFEGADFMMKRGTGTARSSLEQETKAAIDADKLALRKVREEIERKIRVESIQGGKGNSAGDSPCVYENDANAIALRKASMRDIDKRIMLEKNLEIENERRKRIEEIRIQDELDRKMREEKERKIREEIERNIEIENQRKLNIENERKLQEENERKLISEKKKMIEKKNELRKLQENERRTKAEEERKLRVETEWKLREESAGQFKFLKEQKIKEDNEQRLLELERRKSYEAKEQLDQERRRSYEDRLRLIQAGNNSHKNNDCIPAATAAPLHGISEEASTAHGSRDRSVEHSLGSATTATVVGATSAAPLSQSSRVSPRLSPMQTIVHTVMLSVDIHTPPRRDYSTKSYEDKADLTPSSPHTVVDSVSPKNQNHPVHILPHPPGGCTLAPSNKTLEFPSPPEPAHIIDHIPSEHMELLASRTFMPISAAGFSDSVDRFVDRSRRDMPPIGCSEGYRYEGCDLRERPCERQYLDPESIIVKSDDDVLAAKQRQLLKYQTHSESITPTDMSAEFSSNPSPDMSGREYQSPSPKPIPIARKPCKSISENELDAAYVKL